MTDKGASLSARRASRLSDREDEALALCMHHSSPFGVPVASYEDVADLRRRGNRVYLIDVRSQAERDISMEKTAVSSESFEALRLDPRNADDVVLVPYCTIGHRSGVYAKQLIEKGWDRSRVFNGMGVVPFSYDGLELKEPSGAATYSLHVYGEAWNLAHPDFVPHTFPARGGGGGAIAASSGMYLSICAAGALAVVVALMVRKASTGVDGEVHPDPSVT